MRTGIFALYSTCMAKFRLNKQRNNPNQNHEVHKDSCEHYKHLKHFVELGEFIFCSTAMQRARDMGYTKVDGCSICCKECHQG